MVALARAMFHARPETAIDLQAVTDTLVVSDVHLGLPVSRPRPLLATLKAWRFRRLVLLGDILHDAGFDRVCLDGWRVLRTVRDLARQGVEVVWLGGNHDRHLAPLVGTFIGVDLRESYAWTVGGRRCLALHGDRFDSTLPRFDTMSRWLGYAYGHCQRRLSREGGWARRLDRWHSRLVDVHERVAEGAAAHARAERADVVICGHTHIATHRQFVSASDDERAVTYVNAGCWVHEPASFLTVDTGGVRIRECP